MSAVTVFVFPARERGYGKALLFADRFAISDLSAHARVFYRRLRSTGVTPIVARMATIGSLAALHGVDIVDAGLRTVPA